MKKTIITISRQFGSGGREVGEKLAKDLGIPFYDKELIEIAAKESGMDPELFVEDDTSDWCFRIFFGWTIIYDYRIIIE